MSTKKEKEELEAISNLELGVVNARYRSLLFLIDKLKIDDGTLFANTNRMTSNVIRNGLNEIDLYVKKHGKHIDYKKVIKEFTFLDLLYNELSKRLKS